MALELIDRRINIEVLKNKDMETKPPDFDGKTAGLIKLYEDATLNPTKRVLEDLGVGLKRNDHPLQTSMLRYIIHRVAVIYDRPPNRFLEGPNARQQETSADHKDMLKIVERAQLDLAMRDVDRWRALLRQAVIRYYPIDSEQAVVTRVFTPNLVWRFPDPQASDRIEQDFAIGLKLDKNVYEIWWRPPNRPGPQLWRMVWADEAGALAENQPFAETAFVSPYGPVLPISLIYDDYPGGRPWLPPRVSRASWALMLNLMTNELIELIVKQAHVDEVFKTAAPARQPPNESGPGQTRKIFLEDVLETLPKDAKIQDCVSTTEFLMRLFLLSEDLDADELGRNRPTATGAALRVRERGLAARREAQIPLARRDERMAWEKIRAVHNFHRATWSAREISEDFELAIELAEINTPTDPKEELDVWSRQIALGSASIIDLIQRMQNVSRGEAIKIFERVKADMAAFPPITPPAPEAGANSFATDLNQVRGAAGEPPTDSVTDAARNISAADRRADRRSQVPN